MELSQKVYVLTFVQPLTDDLKTYLEKNDVRFLRHKVNNSYFVRISNENLENIKQFLKDGESIKQHEFDSDYLELLYNTDRRRFIVDVFEDQDQEILETFLDHNSINYSNISYWLKSENLLRDVPYYSLVIYLDHKQKDTLKKLVAMHGIYVISQ